VQVPENKGIKKYRANIRCVSERPYEMPVNPSCFFSGYLWPGAGTRNRGPQHVLQKTCAYLSAQQIRKIPVFGYLLPAAATCSYYGTRVPVQHLSRRRREHSFACIPPSMARAMSSPGKERIQSELFVSR